MMVDKKGNKIAFRRIRGRIVPVRVKEAASGIGQAATGVGVSLTGAYLAGAGLKKVVAQSEKAKEVVISAALAFNPNHPTALGRKVSAINIGRASSRLKKAGRIAKISKGVLWGSRITGAALIAAGTEKLVRSATNAKSEDRALRFGATLSGFAAGYGTYKAFASGFDDELLGKAARLAKKLIK